MQLNRQLQALAIAAFAAAPAFAGDITLGAKTELWYDDNVLGTEQDEVSDLELLIVPDLEISERWGAVQAKLNLKPSYELFFDEKQLRGFNYQADASLAWQPTQRTSLELKDTFLRYRNLRLLTSAATPGSTPAESDARDRFTRNIVQLVASHRLSPVDTLQVSGNFSLWDFSDASRFDQQTFGAGANFQRSVSRQLSLGAGASYSRQRIEALGAFPERDTDYVNFSLIANYEPTDTFFVRVSAGPTYVRQPRVRRPSLVRGQLYRFSGNDILVGLLPSTCPTVSSGAFFDGPGCNLIGIDPVAQSFLYSLLVQRALDVVPLLGGTAGRDDYTYFSDISLERKWETVSVSIAYRRDEGSSSGTGFSTVADTFEVRANIQPRRELTISAAAIWEDRKETQTGGRFVTLLDTVPGSGTQPAINNLVPVGVQRVNDSSASESVESLSTHLSAQYRLTAHMSLAAGLSWRDQQATGSSFFSDYERFQVMLGFTVELEPFRW